MLPSLMRAGEERFEGEEERRIEMRSDDADVALPQKIGKTAEGLVGFIRPLGKARSV